MVLIFDFYVDEPACLGVPPYISPYCRYVAGALVCSGVSVDKITYLTVDQWRSDNKTLNIDPELIILIAGYTVPGKYLGGRIGTVAEIREFLDYRNRYLKGTAVVIGGPIRFSPASILHSLESKGGVVIQNDIEFEIERFVQRGGDRINISDIQQAQSKRDRGRIKPRDYELIDQWSEAGAFITTLHPNFPFLMIELETYQGCTRKTSCSFCTEKHYGKPVFRSVKGIVKEVGALYEHGNRYFRLGRQADLITYGADLSRYRDGFPVPNPEALKGLYEGIREAAPNLKVLHMDNINPGAIAVHSNEAIEIIKIMTSYNTPGDTAAMGVETVDPVASRINGLKCDRRQAMKSIEIINGIGAVRESGIPKLLPGLNFIHGLPGESDATFKQNYEFLLEVLDRGLMLRRINIRQVTVHPDTQLERLLSDPALLKNMGIPKKRRNPSLLTKKFMYYRDKIRQEIDRPMLKRVFPPGTILTEVIPESKNLGYVFGRRLGSYPVTVKIPISDPRALCRLETGSPLDVIITGYKERSLLGVTYPIQINRLGRPALTRIPGVGKNRASQVIIKRPLNDIMEFSKITEGLLFGAEADYDFSES